MVNIVFSHERMSIWWDSGFGPPPTTKPNHHFTGGARAKPVKVGNINYSFLKDMFCSDQRVVWLRRLGPLLKRGKKVKRKMQWSHSIIDWWQSSKTGYPKPQCRNLLIEDIFVGLCTPELWKSQINLENLTKTSTMLIFRCHGDSQSTANRWRGRWARRKMAARAEEWKQNDRWNGLFRGK